MPYLYTRRIRYEYAYALWKSLPDETCTLKILFSLKGQLSAEILEQTWVDRKKLEMKTQEGPLKLGRIHIKGFTVSYLHIFIHVYIYMLIFKLVKMM